MDLTLTSLLTQRSDRHSCHVARVSYAGLRLGKRRVEPPLGGDLRCVGERGLHEHVGPEEGPSHTRLFEESLALAVDAPDAHGRVGVSPLCRLLDDVAHAYALGRLDKVLLPLGLARLGGRQ